MSFFNKAGSFTGHHAANLIEGSRLASSQFAIGAKQGYIDRAAQLREQREALGLKAAPVKTTQRKLATAKA